MISVCIATYNGEKFIKEQLDSILCQLSNDDEVIISDDGSTDKTIEIIESYNDDRIKIFHHEKNEKLSKIKEGRNFYYATQNFSNALEKVSGDYVFLSDQDDIWLQNKVSRSLELLKKNDVIVHNYQVVDVNGNLTKEQQFSKNPLHKSVFANIMDSHFRGCCMAFKSDILKKCLPIPVNVIGHDYWIGAIASKYYSIFYEQKPLIQSRWYPESVSSKKKTSLIYKIQFRLTLLMELLKRIKMKK